MRWAALSLVVGLVGCGRLGFDATGGDGGSSDVDAAPAVAGLIVLDGSGGDEVNDVAFDPAGNLAVAGNYASTLTLGSFTAQNIASAGTDGFVAVLATDGTPRWLWSSGATVQGDAENVAWYPDGNLLSVGYFAGMVTRGTSLDAGSNQDVFGVTFDPQGGLLDADHYGGARNVQPRGLDVSAAYIASAGIYADTVDFGAGPLPNAGSNDNAWIAKSDIGGITTTTRALNGPDDVYVNDVALGPSGEVCVTGRFKATTNFGSGPVSPSGQTTFVAVYDDTLSLRWVRTFGTSTVGNGVAFASNGDCVVDGEFAATFTIDGFTAVNAGASDGWLARFGAQAGAVQWLRRFGGATSDIAFAVGVGAGDEVIVAGTFSGSGMLDDLAATTEGPSDGFVLGYDLATGTRRWSALLTGSGVFAPGRGGVSIDVPRRRVAIAAQFMGELRVSSSSVASATDAAGVVVIVPIPE